MIRAFDNPDVPKIASYLASQGLETVEMELLFADLELIEKRIEAVKTGKKITKRMLKRWRSWKMLQARNRFLSQRVDLSPKNKLCCAIAFLTEKPRLTVVNLDEDQFRTGVSCQAGTPAALPGEDIPLLEICAVRTGDQRTG